MTLCQQTADSRAQTGPKLFLAILWHQRQPSYADCLCTAERGPFLFPWVRLHVLRDCYSMAALVERFPDIHLTIKSSEKRR
jgi:alpha-amylase/alpha-mannosidase (GH57 family)